MLFKVHHLACGRNFLIKVTLIAGCLGWYGCTPAKAPKVPVTFASNRTQHLENLIVDIRREFPVPGIAVAMVCNDSVYSTASGISNADNLPFTVNTPFSAGSISEPMLAMAVLELADDGKIDLDEPVITYLPYFKMGGDSYKKITVRHLLTHTSGIPHYSIMWDAPNYDANAPEITTRSISSQLPDFITPGARVKRSPYNYDILADVISKVTGKPFEEYLKSTVFAGLQMRASGFTKPAKTAMPFKVSNWLTYKLKQDTLYPYNRENGGSGGFHTTAKDMAGWIFNILHNDIANQPTVATDVYNQMLSVQYKTGNASAIGLGWDIVEDNGEKIYIKGSQYGGFSNQVILIPGKKIGVAVTSNITSDFNPAQLSRAIAIWLSGKPLAKPKIPVSIVMSKELARTGHIQDAFMLYKTLKQTSAQKYDVSAAALSQFGTNLLHRVNDKPKALKAMKFCVAQYPSSAYAYLALAEGYVFVKDAKHTRMAIDQARKLPDDSGVKAGYLSYLLNNLEILEEKKS